MTVKEIAKLTGKTERAVRNWVVKTAENISSESAEIISSIAEKNSSAGHGKIAEYTLQESIEIMRAGSISESLILILIENAEQKKQTCDKISQTDNMVGNCQLEEIISKTVKATLEAIMPVLQNMVKITCENITQKKPEQKLIPQKTKIEIEITDLPPELARVAAGAINQKLRSDEKKKRINELTDNLFN